MGSRPPWLRNHTPLFSILVLKTNFLSHEPKWMRLSSIHILDEMKNFAKKFFHFEACEKCFRTKNGPKNEKFQNFFWFSELPQFWLYARQVSLKLDEKFFLAHFGPKGSKKFFLTDFNENWRAYSQNYGSSEYQKKFWNFSFFGQFFCRGHSSHTVKQKIFVAKFLFCHKT